MIIKNIPHYEIFTGETFTDEVAALKAENAALLKERELTHKKPEYGGDQPIGGSLNGVAGLKESLAQPEQKPTEPHSSKLSYAESCQASAQEILEVLKPKPIADLEVGDVVATDKGLAEVVDPASPGIKFQAEDASVINSPWWYSPQNCKDTNLLLLVAYFISQTKREITASKLADEKSVWAAHVACQTPSDKEVPLLTLRDSVRDTVKQLVAQGWATKHSHKNREVYWTLTLAGETEAKRLMAQEEVVKPDPKVLYAHILSALDTQCLAEMERINESTENTYRTGSIFTAWKYAAEKSKVCGNVGVMNSEVVGDLQSYADSHPTLIKARPGHQGVISLYTLIDRLETFEIMGEAKQLKKGKLKSADVWEITNPKLEWTDTLDKAAVKANVVRKTQGKPPKRQPLPVIPELP